MNPYKFSSVSGAAQPDTLVGQGNSSPRRAPASWAPAETRTALPEPGTAAPAAAPAMAESTPQAVLASALSVPLHLQHLPGQNGNPFAMEKRK